MFGLEEEKKKKEFQYDLEIEIKQKPQRAKEILAKAQKQEQIIKNELREGKIPSKDFDDVGAILNAYVALEKVVKRVSKH